MITAISDAVQQQEKIAPASLRARARPGLGAVLIGKEEEELVLDVLRRKEPFRYYGCGSSPPPMCETLEKEFAAMVGTKYALAVSSGTAALEVALGALGIGPGDEVIIPNYSWISCFTAVVRVGALPVLAEIDDTFCLASGEIARLSTPRTKAVMIVHYQGVAADMEPLLNEAHEANIKVLEDCAESAGAMYQGKRVGSIGDIGIFSFQVQKSMTSGEGGMVTTNDALLYERAVRMHDIGSLRPYHRQLVEPQVLQFCGSQFRMTELQGAMALAQLRKLDRTREHCRMIQERIVARAGSLAGWQWRRIPDPQSDSGIEPYLLVESQSEADALRKELNALNVNCYKNTGTYFHHTHEYCRVDAAHAPSASPFAHFKSWPAAGYRDEDFPRSTALAERSVALPIGVLYSLEDADYIANCLIESHRVLRA